MLLMPWSGEPETKEQITSDMVDEFLRLPRAERVRDLHLPVSPDGRCVAKKAYRVKISQSRIPRPAAGTYKTCHPEDHSRQAGSAPLRETATQQLNLHIYTSIPDLARDSE